MSKTIDEIMNAYYSDDTSVKKTASETNPAVEPVKLASDAGIRDGENLMKVAAYVGDVIGDRVVSRIAESFGYSPEVTKVASLQDIILDTFTKIAEQVGGGTASGALAATDAEAAQVAEDAVHHATMAINAANDVIASLGQGDEHTAVQMLDSAKSSIQTAKEIASRVNHPAVNAHVQEAASAVAQAASVAESYVPAQ